MANRHGWLYGSDHHPSIDSLGDQETTIKFDQGMATIRTCESIWQRHIEDTLGVMPIAKCRDAREYVIPRNWIGLPRRPGDRQRG